MLFRSRALNEVYMFNRNHQWSHSFHSRCAGLFTGTFKNTWNSRKQVNQDIKKWWLNIDSLRCGYGSLRSGNPECLTTKTVSVLAVTFNVSMKDTEIGKFKQCTEMPFHWFSCWSCLSFLFTELNRFGKGQDVGHLLQSARLDLVILVMRCFSFSGLTYGRLLF